MRIPPTEHDGSVFILPVDVVDDEEVEPPVVVVIEPSGANGPGLAVASMMPASPAFAVRSVNVPSPLLWNR